MLYLHVVEIDGNPVTVHIHRKDANDFKKALEADGETQATILRSQALELTGLQEGNLTAFLILDNNSAESVLESMLTQLLRSE